MKYLFIILITLLICSCATKTKNPPAQIKSNGSELKFDFDKARSLVYNYKQETQSIDINSFIDKDEKLDTTLSWLDGELILKIKEDKTADYILKGITVKTLFSDSKSDTSTNEVPIQIIQGFNEYGENLMNPAYNQKLSFYFPIPQKSKSINGNYKLEINMPFNANGSALNVSGIQNISIVDTIEINKRKCLVIESVSKIDKIDIPDELEGEYKCDIETDFKGYFDYENGHYISGVGSSNVSIYMKFKMKDIDDEEKIEQMSMTTSEEFEYDLKAIE